MQAYTENKPNLRQLAGEEKKEKEKAVATKNRATGELGIGQYLFPMFVLC